MIRALALALILPAAAAAQNLGCPTGAPQRVYDLTRQAKAGKAGAEELVAAASELAGACKDDRALIGLILAMFTAEAEAEEPPARFNAELNALRTAGRMAGGGRIEPARLTGPDGMLSWGEADARNAYWDLMFAVSSDFLVYGVHAELYTAGSSERIGCLAFPAEEASALARHGAGNEDGGELLARLSFLGRGCDGPGHEVAGQVALYFAAHASARDADPDYAGLTRGDIRSGLALFLERHLAGRDASDLFTAEEVARLRAW